MDWRELSRDEQACLMALGDVAGVRVPGGWRAWLEQIAARAELYAPRAADGSPRPFGQRRARAAVLALCSRNLVVRHGRLLAFSLHIDGARLVVEERRRRSG